MSAESRRLDVTLDSSECLRAAKSFLQRPSLRVPAADLCGLTDRVSEIYKNVVARLSCLSVGECHSHVVARMVCVPICTEMGNLMPRLQNPQSNIDSSVIRDIILSELLSASLRLSWGKDGTVKLARCMDTAALRDAGLYEAIVNSCNDRGMGDMQPRQPRGAALTVSSEDLVALAGEISSEILRYDALYFVARLLSDERQIEQIERIFAQIPEAIIALGTWDVVLLAMVEYYCDRDQFVDAIRCASFMVHDLMTCTPCLSAIGLIALRRDQIQRFAWGGFFTQEQAQAYGRVAREMIQACQLREASPQAERIVQWMRGWPADGPDSS